MNYSRLINLDFVLCITLFSVILLLFSSSTLSFADAWNVTTLNVSIRSLGKISVSPAFLNWSNVEPGTTGGIQTIEITNTGSINVTNIYAYLDTLTVEATRPYLATAADSYASGGVILMKNQTYPNLSWVGRIEWNWTNTLSNADYSNLDDPVAWGFFKNMTYEFVWAIGNGSYDLCNNSGAQFAIEDDLDDGTQSTRTPTVTDINRNFGNVNYSIFSIDRSSSPLYNHCVAVNRQCTKIYIYKYDKRANFTSCANSAYIRDVLTPGGDSEIMTLDVYMPEGIPEGNMSSSVLTIYGS